MVDLAGKGAGAAPRDADIFISYQRDTADKARKLADALRRDNREVFIDLKLSSDARWRADIERKLGRARCVVAVWSKKASTSGWVNYEAFRAQQEGKLIAVTFDPIKADELPGWLTDQQITSLKDWNERNEYHNGWLSVSRAVHAKCSQLPNYRFKGWLGGGPAHERVTSLAFHPTEDARLISTGAEGHSALWLATRANPEGRGEPEFDPSRSTQDRERSGQLSRCAAPAPPKDWQRTSIWKSHFSADGERVVLACRDGVARVYDGSLRHPILTLPHNEKCGVEVMLFGNGGKGQHKDGVLDACFTPDGFIVTVGGSKALVWDQAGQLVHQVATPEGARSAIVSALYSEVLEGVIIGDKLGKVRVLDHRVGEIGYQIDDRADTEVHTALGPSLIDGKIAQGMLAIVSQSPLDSDIRFHPWAKLPDQDVGAFAKPRANPVVMETPPIRGIALHPRAPVVAVASSAVQPKLFDYENNEVLPLGRSSDRESWHDNAVSAVAFSANGQFLAVGSEDGRISIWETRDTALSSNSSGDEGRRDRRSGDQRA